MGFITPTDIVRCHGNGVQVIVRTHLLALSVLMGTLKHTKSAKYVLCVLLRLGDLSANQMHGTQMNLLTELV